jgi:hypothetical protein
MRQSCTGGVPDAALALHRCLKLWPGGAGAHCCLATNASQATRRGPMVVYERCVLCGKKDVLDKLISACMCYKKSDSSRMHKACLESVLANEGPVTLAGAQRQVFTHSLAGDEPMRCPRCREPYKVKVRLNFNFKWSRCLAVRRSACSTAVFQARALA